MDLGRNFGSLPNDDALIDAADEPLDDAGLDLYAQILRIIVGEIRGALADQRTTFPRDPANEPDVYSLAGLAHCCLLLEQLDDIRLDENLFRTYLVGRACLEAWLAAAFVFFKREKGLEEIQATFGNSVRTQVNQIREAYENAKRQYEKARTSRESVLQINAGIAMRNQRDGTNDPLEEIPETPIAPRDNSVGTDILVDSVKTLTGDSVTYDEMAKQIGTLAKAAGAGGGDWSALYNVPYRSMSNFGAHPTYFVLDSYVDKSASAYRIQAEPYRNWRVHSSTMDVAHLVAMLGAVVFEKLGLDVSNLKGVTAWWDAQRAQLHPDAAAGTDGDSSPTDR